VDTTEEHVHRLLPLGPDKNPGWLHQKNMPFPHGVLAVAAEGTMTRSSRSNDTPLSPLSHEGCKLDVDKDRLDACIRRIKTVFKLEDSRTGVCLEDVLGLLKENPSYNASNDVLITELMEKLGTSSASRFGERSMSSRSPTRTKSFAGKKKSNDVYFTHEVKMMKFAELLLVEELTDLIPDHRPEHEDVLRLIRAHVFHQDTLGIISSEILSLEMLITKKAVSFERYLDILMNLVIVANAITVGWFATSRGVGWGAPQTADLIFTSIFLMEMLIKIWRTGLRRHFCGPEWSWNVFDASIVCLGLADFIMTMAVVNSNSFNPSNLLALRLIRVGRLLRVVRMALFRELKLMINGIVGLLKTLSCALIILLLIVYFLGICLVQLLDISAGEVVPEQAVLFDGVPRSMFTVFRCLMTGDCTAANGTPITLHLNEALGWPYTIAYSLCCVLVNYGIGSLITALVVDTTLNEAKKTEYRNSIKEATRKTMAMRLRSLGLLFEQEQLKEDGLEHHAGANPSMLFLSRQGFISACKRQEVKEILDGLDIEEADRHDLFDAIDADGNGFIELDELVEGITKMGGKARKADTVASRLKISTLLRRVEQTHVENRDAHRRILERIDQVLSNHSALGGITNDTSAIPLESKAGTSSSSVQIPARAQSRGPA